MRLVGLTISNSALSRILRLGGNLSKFQCQMINYLNIRLISGASGNHPQLFHIPTGMRIYEQFTGVYYGSPNLFIGLYVVTTEPKVFCDDINLQAVDL